MFKKMIVGGSLSALLAISLAGTQAAALTVKPKSRCSIPAVKLSQPGDKVNAAGACYDSKGKRLPVSWKITYTQSDYAGNSCGVFSSNRSSFSPKMDGTFYLSVNARLMPAHTVKGVKQAKYGVKFQLGHWQLQCGHPGGFPFQLCDLQTPPFTPVSCAMQLAPGYVGPQLPQLGGEPMIIGNTAFMPPVLSKGTCSEHAQGPVFQWMSAPVQYSYLSCSDGSRVSPSVTVYYWPPGANASCVFDQRSLPNNQYSHFALAADWKSWGGKLLIIYKVSFYGPSSGLSQTPDGIEYADIYLQDLTGGVNGCTELQNIKY